MSRTSFAPSIMHGTVNSVASSARRTRPRSRSRDQANNVHVHSHHRPNSRYDHYILLSTVILELKMAKHVFIFSRYSLAGSTHTLNNYCDTSDNWTDHDMEIYMARNATTRNGLVPL